MTNSAAQTIAGTGEAGTSVQLFDGGSALGSAITVDGTGHWSASVTLSGQGAHSITARDTDAAGNAATSGAVGYTLDSVAPATPTLDLASASDTGVAGDHITAAVSPTITGMTEGGSTVTLHNNTNGTLVLIGSTTAAGDGSFSFTTDHLDTDIHDLAHLTAMATDTAGNTASSAELTLEIQPAVARHDFGADGSSDILWLSDSGDAYQWQLDTAGTIASMGGNLAGPGWSILGTGDFSGDGHADILWRYTDGTTWMWQMNGTALLPASGLVGNVDASWSVLGVADFTGDGKADIVWKHAGDNALWLFAMEGTTIDASFSGPMPYAGAEWAALGIGRFIEHDHQSVLFQNSVSGDLYAWTMEGSTIVAQHDLGIPTAGVGGTDWQVAGIANFNGDRWDDILLRSTATGDLVLRESLGSGNYSDLAVLNPGQDWVIESLGDFKGDGHTDILWRNSLSGGAYLWSMDSNAIAAQHDLGNPGAEWHIIA